MLCSLHNKINDCFNRPEKLKENPIHSCASFNTLRTRVFHVCICNVMVLMFLHSVITVLRFPLIHSGNTCVAYKRYVYMCDYSQHSYYFYHNGCYNIICKIVCCILDTFHRFLPCTIIMIAHPMS